MVDFRPIGAGLLLWNDQGKALIKKDSADGGRYNLFDVVMYVDIHSGSASVAGLDYIIDRFRNDTFGNAEAEVVIHQTLTFMRAKGSAHDCRRYDVLVGTAPDLPNQNIPCIGGVLEWVHLERLAPEECHPAFRYELKHYLRAARR